MSNTHMTVEEAARHLGVSHRTVRSYIARDLLPTVRVAGSRRKWLLPDAVEELCKDQCGASPSSIGDVRRELLEARASLRRLRAEMDVVLRMLDVHESPLNLDATSAQKLHDTAIEDLRATSWTLDEMSQWAEVLLRLNEEDLRAVAATTRTRPWSPFLRLCVDMIVYASSHPSYKTDTEMQGMHRKLTEARRRLRVAALCYDDMYGADPDRELRRAALLDSPASVRESLLSRVRKKST